MTIDFDELARRSIEAHEMLTEATLVLLTDHDRLKRRSQKFEHLVQICQKLIQAKKDYEHCVSDLCSFGCEENYHTIYAELEGMIVNDF